MRFRSLCPIAIVAVLLPASDGRATCIADCDGNGNVALSEAVRAIAIALGSLPIAACGAADPDGSGIIAVDELVRTIGESLRVDGRCCGDQSAQRAEECDDGNVDDGDGCSRSCRLEPGGDVCAGVPSSPGTDLAAEVFLSGLDRPVHVAAPPLDPKRLFVVEQPGRILAVDDGQLRERPFLDIVGKVGCCGERGLLSVAFHPDYQENGRFFVDYTNRAGDTVIARYERSADPDRADPASERILLTIEQPFSNHNGGQLAFGPDGFLYAGLGDGGSGGDPLETAQDDGRLLGKLLRLDVDVDDPPYYRVPADNPHPERGDPLGLVWAKGLRNPWRFGFDRQTGDLYIADVGQGDFEEVDVQDGASRGGENYGWDIFEARSCFEPAPFPDCPAPSPDFVFPVVDYSHAEGCSVTGGFVYRGCALPDLRGTYFYGDYCSGFVRSFVLFDGAATDQRDWTDALTPPAGPTLTDIASFGEDARGELYVADLDGQVFKIVPAVKTDVRR